MPISVAASDLTKRFPGVVAVDRLTFEVHAGEIFGLVGPDGAGKTTTLRMLAGVLSPDGGSATVAGADIAREPEAAKARLSYMPQRFGLYEDLTVAENIRFYADVFGVSRAEREARSRQLLDAAGMDPFTTRLAGKLSGGMKQKLGLVCALIHRPLRHPARRADQRRRSGLASGFLAHPVLTAERRHCYSDVDILSRRSRTLSSGGAAP